ncbi:MAG: L-seryl-tRNA(Sec) selenium transferase [Desulfohalobiaceae bacterium]
MSAHLYQLLPAVDRVLEGLGKERDLDQLPRSMLKELVNQYLELSRQRIKSGRIQVPEELAWEAIWPELLQFVRKGSRPRFRRVLNATGVVVHTNLGRSLLADNALDMVGLVCSSYNNLEFSLQSGERGSRYELVQDLICELTGAEAALVVNNNAAAVLLTLDTLAKEREVIVSRGQLVEIGGSFRIPEVMAKSGALLHEVGATNRTHLKDYEQAINQNTAALLRVHTSNFRIVGFQKEVGLGEMVDLGNRYGLPVLEDLGSGNFYRFPSWTGLDEPLVGDVLKKGAAVVTFSGDKLLGGPQAGLILGSKDYVQRIQKNPLNRALRIDKMTLAALEATLRLYKDPELAARKIPTLRMVLQEEKALSSQARRLAGRLKKELGQYFEVGTVQGFSRVGGGASPELNLPTRLVTLQPQAGLDLEAFRQALLDTDPPLLGRVEQDRFCLDPRTLLPQDRQDVSRVLFQAAKACAG